MLKPAQKYLVVRSLGAPAVLLSLAMQGVFRGFKDTKTPLYATSKQVFKFNGHFFFPSIHVSLTFGVLVAKRIRLFYYIYSSSVTNFYQHVLVCENCCSSNQDDISFNTGCLECSDWRCSKHNSRPNIHFRAWFGCYWCSHCPCYLPVRFSFHLLYRISRFMCQTCDSCVLCSFLLLFTCFLIIAGT